MSLFIKRFLQMFSNPSRSSGKDSTASLPEKAPYKRSFDRFPIEFEVIVSEIDSMEDHDIERSELHDVSGGGAMFISRLPGKYYPGQFLKLDIFLAGTEDVRACIKTEASVVRIHALETDDPETSSIKAGIAVKFHKPFEFERMDDSFFR